VSREIKIHVCDRLALCLFRQSPQTLSYCRPACALVSAISSVFQWNGADDRDFSKQLIQLLFEARFSNEALIAEIHPLSLKQKYVLLFIQKLCPGDRTDIQITS